MNRRHLLALLGGASALPPIAARAQQKAIPVIGFLSSTAPGPSAVYVTAFREGLGETGFFDGKTVAMEYRWAEGRYERLPAMAAELVARKVDVIAAGAVVSALAAKSATSTIPIVFTCGDDPIATGLVASLAHPGGNLTGVSFLIVELNAKRFEILAELVPQARVIALLVNPNLLQTKRVIRETQEGAGAKGMQVRVLHAATESEIDAAFALLPQMQAGALLVGSDPYFNSRYDQLVALARRHAIPTMYQGREFVDSGGLVSYGTSLKAVYHLLGIYAGKILSGAKPADLPIQQPTIFEMVINLKTAKTLGLTVSPVLLAQADEVID